MRSVLVITQFDVDRDPRPKRVVECIKQYYQVTLVGRGVRRDPNIDYQPLDYTTKRPQYIKIINAANLLLRNYKEAVSNQKVSQIEKFLNHKKFDVIICHDLVFLPMLIEHRNGAKIIFDAREYYPLQYESSFVWRFLYKNLMYFLCDKHMKLCDKILTVSNTIAQKYSKQFAVEVEVYQSWSEYFDCRPHKVDPSNIKIIHHGGSNRNRKIENMIRVMDFVDNRFTLDLMLLDEGSKYSTYLKKEADKRDNVRIIDSVKQEEIILFTNQYDIGMFLCPQTTFNLKYALPNKLFEFIQARLAVAISPSIEMKGIVQKYGVGIVAKDFTVQAMADELNKLTVKDIENYKWQSNAASKELNASKNCDRFQEIIEEMIN